MNLFKLIHGWLSRPRGFLEPRPLEMSVFYAKDGERLMLGFDKPMPRVILVTDKLLRQWDPEAPSLGELGYVQYDRESTMRCDYYARRPWVWLLKAGMGVKRLWWRFLSVTYGRFWHVKDGFSNIELKWCNVRLGSGAAQIAREDAALLRMRVGNLRHEVEELKQERNRAFNDGRLEGWEHHQKALEVLVKENSDAMQKS
jgi:hypothetical protein